jgi:hypothetical protein
LNCHLVIGLNDKYVLPLASLLDGIQWDCQTIVLHFRYDLTLTNMPGHSLRSVLGKIALRVIVPEVVLS